MTEESKFKEYVTSSAFRLDLSPNMIQWLLFENKYGGKPRKKSSDSFMFENPHFVHAFNGLQRRGLMSFSSAEKYTDIKPQRLTQEGKLVAKLCLLAGYQLKHEQKEKIA